jgi:hypothetical protein
MAALHVTVEPRRVCIRLRLSGPEFQPAGVRPSPEIDPTALDSWGVVSAVNPDGRSTVRRERLPRVG